MSEIKKNTADVTRYVMIVDSATGAPETGVDVTTLDLQYTRNRSAPAAKVDATSLAAINSVHGDNKIFEVSGTSSPGLYRVDWPDAAFATGVDKVELVVTGSGFHPAVEEVDLTGWDNQDAVRGGMSALPNADAQAPGGLYTRGTGAGQINQNANGQIDINLVKINGDLTNGNNATLNLKVLSVINNSGTAGLFQSTGGGGSGILAIGEGSNPGIAALGGASASGVVFTAESGSNKHGLELVKDGTGKDIDADEIGTPVALDGGTASLAGMLTKMADDNGGATFDSTDDSLNKLQTIITAGFPASSAATAGNITTGTDTANAFGDTATANDTAWQVAAATAVEGFGLNMDLTFSLGTSVKVASVTVNAKESLQGVVHVWAWNYSSSSWDQISNTASAITGNSYVEYAPYPMLAVHQQTSDGEAKIRFTSTDTGTARYLWLDKVNVNAVGSGFTPEEIADAVAAHNVAEHTDHDSFGFRTALGGMIKDYDITTGDTASSFTCSGLPATANYYQYHLVQVHDVTNDREAGSWIASMDDSGVVVLGEALPFTPDTSSELYIKDATVQPNAELFVNPAYDHANLTIEVNAGLRFAGTLVSPTSWAATFYDFDGDKVAGGLDGTAGVEVNGTGYWSDTITSPGLTAGKAYYVQVTAVYLGVTYKANGYLATSDVS